MPVTKVTKFDYYCVWVQGRVASQVSFAPKMPVALQHMPVNLQFCFTHFETHVQMLEQSGSRHLSAAVPRTQEPSVQQPVLLSTNAD